MLPDEDYLRHPSGDAAGDPYRTALPKGLPTAPRSQLFPLSALESFAFTAAKEKSLPAFAERPSLPDLDYPTPSFVVAGLIHSAFALPKWPHPASAGWYFSARPLQRASSLCYRPKKYPQQS
jgi:hypothetical protein